jgi:hypothetical protein
MPFDHFEEQSSATVPPGKEVLHTDSPSDVFFTLSLSGRIALVIS